MGKARYAALKSSRCDGTALKASLFHCANK
jgi:hypothetical protein